MHWVANLFKIFCLRLVTVCCAEGLQSKLEDPILHRNIYKYDIIVLLETWLPQGFQVKFPGFYSYSIYRPKNPKAKRCSGG